MSVGGHYLENQIPDYACSSVLMDYFRRMRQPDVLQHASLAHTQTLQQTDAYVIAHNRMTCTNSATGHA